MGRSDCGSGLVGCLVSLYQQADPKETYSLDAAKTSPEKRSRGICRDSCVTLDAS